MPVTITVGDWSQSVTAFIDTGSEISLVKRGLLPDGLLKKAARPMQLLTASGQPMRGGSREVNSHLKLEGKSAGDPPHKRVVLTTPTTLHEADMMEDILLSY